LIKRTRLGKQEGPRPGSGRACLFLAAIVPEEFTQGSPYTGARGNPYGNQDRACTIARDGCPGFPYWCVHWHEWWKCHPRLGLFAPMLVGDEARRCWTP